MSCISYIRYTNIVYNSHDKGSARHIYDEHYPLNRKSTLFYLDNGGGKSVQIQFLKAVHTKSKKARSSAGKENQTRYFDDFFKYQTNFPMYVMVEYSMDNSDIKAMVGLMLRKHMAKEEDEHDSAYDQIGFISEYTDSCKCDIRNIPFCYEVTSANGTATTFKTWKESIKMFEEFEATSGLKFFYYNLDHPGESKKYYEKLREYQIYREEWEDVIFKVNQEEGGLSKYFKDCRSKEDIIKKIFIDTVLSHIDNDRQRSKKLIDAVKKYILEYNATKNIIDNVTAYEEFVRLLSEDVKPLIEEMEGYASKAEDGTSSAIALYKTLTDEVDKMDICLSEINDKKAELNNALVELNYAKTSYKYYQAKDEMETAAIKLETAGKLVAETNSGKEQAKYLLECCNASRERQELQKIINEYNKVKSKYEVAKSKDLEITAEVEKIEPLLYRKAFVTHNAYIRTLEEKKECKVSLIDEKNETTASKKETEKNKDELIRKVSSYKNTFKNYTQSESEYNTLYEETLSRASEKSIYLNENIISEIKDRTQKELIETEQDRIRTGQLIKGIDEQYDKDLNNKTELSTKLGITRNKLESAKENDKRNEKMLSDRRAIFSELEYNDDEFDMVRFDSFIERYETAAETKISNAEKDIEDKQLRIRELKAYLKGEISTPKGLIEEMRDNGLDPQHAFKWLKSRVKDRDKLKEILEQNPLVPYALIMSSENIEKLDHIKTSNTSYMVPVIKRDDIERLVNSGEKIKYSGNVRFYAKFNDRLIDEEDLRKEIEQLDTEIWELSNTVSKAKETLNRKKQQANIVRHQNLDKKTYEGTKNDIRIYTQSIESLEQEIKDLEKNLDELKEKRAHSKEVLEKAKESIRYLTDKINGTESIEKKYEVFCKELVLYEDTSKKLEDAYKAIETLGNKIDIIGKQIEATESEIRELGDQCRQSEQEKALYKEYPKETRDITDNEYSVYKARYEALKKKHSGEVSDLEEQLRAQTEHMNSKKEYYDSYVEKHHLNIEDIECITYTKEIQEQYELENEAAINDYNDALWQQSGADTIYRTKKDSFKSAEKKVSVLVPKNEIGDIDFERRRSDIEKQISDNNDKQTNVLQKRSLYESSGNILRTNSVIPTERFDDAGNEERMDISSIDDISDYIRNIINKLRTLKSAYEKTKENLVTILHASANNPVYVNSDGVCPQKLTILGETLISAEDSNITDYLKKSVSKHIDITEHLIDECRASVERDKEDRNQRAEAIYQFLEEIDENLNFLDSNSSIEIYGKIQKMMELETPNWEKQSDIYKANIAHILDELVEDAVQILKKNADGSGNEKSFNDFVDGTMNIANLYDKVVNVSNIRFSLRKVEKYDVYPYSWNEVLLQSGGENSLAAFIIIANLMNYTRRKTNDYMKETKEWKVIAMDNPFAGMNAAHLLKPMRDIADKLRIQIIAWTGHQQPAINQMFDNVINQMIIKEDEGSSYIVMDKNTSVIATDERLTNTRLEVIGQETLVLE